MATIGFDSTTGTGAYTAASTDTHLLMSHSTVIYTPSAAETLTTVGAYIRNNSSGQIEVGVYDITGGVSGATLIGSATLTGPGGGDTTAIRVTGSVNVALTVGNTYAVAYRAISSTVMYTVYVATGAESRSSLTGSSALAASWTASTTSDNKSSLFAITTTAQTLATITDPIVDGATSDSGTYSGFTGTPDTLTIETTGALYSTAMTSLSAAAGSFTFNVPGLPTVNTARTPYTTASWAIRAKLSVSAESATKTVTHNPPSGYAALEITGTWSIVSETSFAYGWDAAPGLTSQLVYPTANNLTVNASTGAFTTDQTTGTIQYYLWDVADATLKPFIWTLSGTLFRASSLTTSTLTASALTASTLIA